MDSPVTTQTLNLLEVHGVKVLHLEPTSVCNLECPLCARETSSDFDKRAHRYSLTTDDIKGLVSEDIIENLDKMFMCGNYGDPAAGNALEIADYFRRINSNITLGMNTNGSLRDAAWWRSLASYFNHTEDYVVFSIDGLEDTNHIYRRGAVWGRVMNNATAFIEAGGNAHWDMLVYQYNQHQVQDVINLAHRMGFKIFRSKASRRDSDIVEFVSIQRKTQEPGNDVDCFVEKEHSIYLASTGAVYPCCWLGADSLFSTNTIDQFPQIKGTWGTTGCHTTCKKICGKTATQTSYQSQWTNEIHLN